MSARPALTASYVLGGAATARGKWLQRILPAVFFSSWSHHSFCAMLSGMDAGTQVDAFSTVWADADMATPANAAAANRGRARCLMVVSFFGVRGARRALRR